MGLSSGNGNTSFSFKYNGKNSIESNFRLSDNLAKDSFDFNDSLGKEIEKFDFSTPSILAADPTEAVGYQDFNLDLLSREYKEQLEESISNSKDSLSRYEKESKALDKILKSYEENQNEQEALKNSGYNSIEEVKEAKLNADNMIMYYQSIVTKTKEMESLAAYNVLIMTEDYQNFEVDSSDYNSIDQKHKIMQAAHKESGFAQVSYDQALKAGYDISPLEFYKALQDLKKSTDKNEEGISYDMNYQAWGCYLGIGIKLEGNEDFTSKEYELIEKLAKVEEANPEYAKMYNYLYEQRGPREANEYLLKLEDTLNQQVGLLESKEILEELSKQKDPWSYVENYFNISVDGFKDGTISWYEGLENAFNASKVMSAEEYKKMYVLQALQSGDYTGEYLSRTYQVAQGVGNMAPSIALSMLSFNPLVGKVALGLSVEGNAEHEAKMQGYDGLTAVKYGIANAAVAVTLESFLGRVPGLSKISVGSKTLLSNVLSEIGEEEIEALIATPLCDKFILGKETSLEELKEVGWETAVNTFWTSLVFSTSSKGMNLVIEGKNVSLSVDQITELDRLITQEGKSVDEAMSIVTKIKAKNNNKTADSNASSEKVVDSSEVQKKLDRYQRLSSIIESNDYKDYMDNAEKGYAQRLNAEYNGAEAELRTLENELHFLGAFDTNNDVEINSMEDEVTPMLQQPNNEVTYVSEQPLADDGSGPTAELIRPLDDGSSPTTDLEKPRDEINSSISNSNLNKTNNYFDNIRQRLQNKFNTKQITAQEHNQSLEKVNKFFQLSRNKVNTTQKTLRLNSQEAAAHYFNDPKQFIFSKLDEIARKNPNDVNLQKSIIDLKSAEVCNINEANFVNYFYQFLSKNDKKIVDNMYTNSTEYNNIFSDFDKLMIRAFTKSIGPVLSAYCRKAEVYYNNSSGGSLYNGTSKKSIGNLLTEGYQKMGKLDQLSEFIDADKAVNAMDQIIEKSPELKENIIVYRAVNDLFLDGNKLTTFQIGQRFNDSAFLSTSVTPVTTFSSFRNIMMEIEVPKGTKAAYLESYTGAKNYCQQELLLGRNHTFEITSMPTYNEKTGQLMIKAKLVEQPKSFVSEFQLDKFQSDNFVNNYYDHFVKKGSGLDSKQIELTDMMGELKNSGLLARYESEVRQLRSKNLYNFDIPEHNIDHVERVLLFSMYMGKKMNLSDIEMDALIEAAKLHDSGRVNLRTDTDHGHQSALKAKTVLEGNYSENTLNIISAAIEYHEPDDNLGTFMKIMNDYNIDKSDYNSVEQIASILKDADAIDRVRFPGNLRTDVLRNEVALQLVKPSYQIQQLRGSNLLNQKITNSYFSQQNIQEIRNFQEKGVSDYLLNYYYTYFQDTAYDKIMRLFGGGL